MQFPVVSCRPFYALSLKPMRYNGNKEFYMKKKRQERQYGSIEVDVESLLSIENDCKGCARGERCCCSSYEVCVTAAEMKRIIRVLPEAAKFCPHLLVDGGYDNVFGEEEDGLFSIDTNEEGLCLFAYWSHRRIHCSLHSVAVRLALPLEQVKPKVCLLWPMHFSEGTEVLAATGDAFLYACNTRKTSGSRSLCHGFAEAIDMVYGAGCGAQVMKAAEDGERRALLVIKR
jgi:hypothetical protein